MEQQFGPVSGQSVDQPLTVRVQGVQAVLPAHGLQLRYAQLVRRDRLNGANGPSDVGWGKLE